MKLLPVFIQVAGELGIGTAFFLAIQKTGEIRQSFFSFMSWLAAISFLLITMANAGTRFYADAYFPSVVFAGVAALQFSKERFKLGKSLILLSAFLAAFFLFGRTWTSPGKIEIKELAILNLLAGTFLFGWSNGAMILGHWYLVMRGLSFSHFQRATQQLLVAVVVRTVCFGVASYLVFQAVNSGTRPPLDMLFFSMRILWGLILPAAFSFMAWRCALTGSNQAGTGLLYIAEVAVLIGEILAGSFGM
jgi:hypothetical protein